MRLLDRLAGIKPAERYLMDIIEERAFQLWRASSRSRSHAQLVAAKEVLEGAMLSADTETLNLTMDTVRRRYPKHFRAITQLWKAGAGPGSTT